MDDCSWDSDDFQTYQGLLWFVPLGFQLDTPSPTVCCAAVWVLQVCHLCQLESWHVGGGTVWKQMSDGLTPISRKKERLMTWRHSDPGGSQNWLNLKMLVWRCPCPRGANISNPNTTSGITLLCRSGGGSCSYLRHSSSSLVSLLYITPVSSRQWVL